MTYYSIPVDTIGRLTIIPAAFAQVLFRRLREGNRKAGQAGSVLFVRSIHTLILRALSDRSLLVAFMPELLTAWLW